MKCFARIFCTDFRIFTFKASFLCKHFRPQFNGVLPTIVKQEQVTLLRKELHSLLAKEAIEHVPLPLIAAINVIPLGLLYMRTFHF